MFTLLQTCPGWGGGAGWGGMGGGMMGSGGAWGLGFLWPLLWLLVFAAIVLGGVYLFTQMRPADGAGGSNGAMELLRERYARGEVSDEEFEERSARLSTPDR